MDKFQRQIPGRTGSYNIRADGLAKKATLSSAVVPLRRGDDEPVRADPEDAVDEVEDAYAWLLQKPDINIDKIYCERFDERALRAWQSQGRAENVQIRKAVQRILDKSRGNLLETVYHHTRDVAGIRHPDISLGWGYSLVMIHTHAIKGLSINDFILAAKIDQINEA